MQSNTEHKNWWSDRSFAEGEFSNRQSSDEAGGGGREAIRKERLNAFLGPHFTRLGLDTHHRNIADDLSISETMVSDLR